MPPTARGDDAFMRRALELAANGLGRTSPNPAVGAVVVRDGEIIGEGWHERAGAPHAEPVALVDAAEGARGATIYVTLEPCSHWGRTPPCTRAIIEAGISRVVYACDDCDVRCAGKAAGVFRQAEVEVTAGVLADEALRLNEAYFKHKQTQRPFITLKMACSLDGKIATRTGDSKWVTGEEARLDVHRMRGQSDAVMVGVGTILADDPRLTTRLGPLRGRDALRVVADSQARTPTDAAVVSGDNEVGCLIAVREDAPGDRVEALRQAGAEVVAVRGNERGVALVALAEELGRRNVMSVLLEGGATLAESAVHSGIVDKFVLFYAPKLVGGADAPTVLDGMGVETMDQARRVDIRRIERIGADMKVEGYPCSQD